jgi:hypothetical protein
MKIGQFELDAWHYLRIGRFELAVERWDTSLCLLEREKGELKLWLHHFHLIVCWPGKREPRFALPLDGGRAAWALRRLADAGEPQGEADEVGEAGAGLMPAVTVSDS